MKFKPDQYSHFTAVHVGDTSVFTAGVPIVKDKEVDHSLKEIPKIVDTVFLTNTVSELFQTNTKGCIPLQPLKTQLTIERETTDQHKLDIARSRHFVFRALTGSAELRTATLEFDKTHGRIDSLSLVCDGSENEDPISIELRAVINNPHEDVYEIVTHRPGVDPESMTVDAGVASNFVHALRENQAGSELPELSIEIGLTELIEKSNSYTINQSGSYDINGDKNIQLRVDREQKIQKGIATTCALALELQQTSFIDSLETVRAFSLITKPKRAAKLDYLIRSLDRNTTPEDRADMFNDISIHLRENPTVLFSALLDAATKLAAYNLR